MGPPKPLVLVLDADRGIRKLVRAILRADALRVVDTATLPSALAAARARAPDVVVADPGFFDADGGQVVDALHRACDAPILVLSSSGLERDTVRALEAGADDCIDKPFGDAELLARVRVALRRGRRSSPNPSDGVISVGSLRMDLAKRLLLLDGAEIRLTSREYRVLETLMRNADAVVTQEALLREVWGPDHETHVHNLRGYVHQLRRKLEKDPARPRYLITEPAVGYRIRAGS